MGFLEGKNIVVTAGSKGIGAAVVKKAVEEGANVVFCSRDPDDGEIKEIATSFKCNLTQEDSISDFTAFVKDNFTPDGIVLNHGGPAPGNFDELTLSDWDEAYRLLLRSSVQILKDFLPLMSKRGGSVVFLTSISLKYPLNNLLLSNSVRLSLLGLMRSLVDDYGNRGIRFNMVLPGYTNTERVQKLAENSAVQEGVTAQEIYERWSANIPIGRLADPSEIAEAVIFLLSDRSSYLNGATIQVDGGYLRGI